VRCATISVIVYNVANIAHAQLADDPQKVARISVLYRDMEYGANARSIFLPWLPNKPRDRRDAATRELFGMLYGIIETRSKSGRSEDDALQVLLDDGYTAVGIVKVGTVAYESTGYVGAYFSVRLFPSL
jgi:cytochrome P450